MFKQQSLSLEQALQKLRHYCGYQERCHQEVKEKLYSFGLRKPDVETAVATLIGEDRLNEERFAIQFAGGRFRLKHWGKAKIRYELKQKQVSDYCIQKALGLIDTTEYQHTLRRLAAEKWESLKEINDVFVRKHKVGDYLQQKGYEPERIRETVQKINDNYA